MGPRPHTYFGPEASASKFKLLHPDFISYLTERYGVGCLKNSVSFLPPFTYPPHIQAEPSHEPHALTNNQSSTVPSAVCKALSLHLLFYLAP